MNKIPKQDQWIIELLRLAENRAVIAGGAARRWYEGNTVANADIDVFFSDQKGYDDVSAILELLKTNKLARLSCSSKNANTWNYNGIIIQLIKTRWFLTVGHLFEYFDITAAMAATNGVEWWVDPRFIEHSRTKELHFGRPGAHPLPRLIKYYIYGFSPSHQTITDIANDPKTVWDNQANSYEEYFEF